MAIYIALDLETTGFDPVADYPIEVAAIKFDENQIYEKFQTLVNPGVAIPQIVTHITGIRDEDVKNAPSLMDVKQQIIDFIGSAPIVGHNITFDTSFLRNKGFDLKNPEFDTLPLTSILYPTLPSYSLETISAAFDIADKQDHRALSDTIACAKLFQKLLKKIHTLSPEFLQTIQEIFLVPAPHIGALFNGGTPGGTYQKEAVLQRSKEPLLTSGRQDEIENTIYATIENHETLLLEAGIGNGKYTALIKAILRHHERTKEKTLISLASTGLQEILFNTVFPEFQKNNDTNTIVLVKEMYKYLSPKRLKNYMDKPEKTSEEACFMAKIYLWSTYTEQGEQDEISLTNEEYRRWENINVNPWQCDITTEMYLQKAYKKEENANILVCYHKALAKEVMSPINHLKHIQNLIICEAHLFEKHMVAATSRIYSLDFIRERFSLPEAITQKMEFFFGMLGMIFNTFTTNPGDSLLIQDAHRNTKEWQQIRELFFSLVDQLKAGFDDNASVYGELLEELSIIENLFSNEKQTSSAVLYQNHEEQIRLRYIPIETMDTLWNMDFFKEQTSRIFMSSIMRVAKSFDYIRDRLRIPETAKECVIPANPEIAKNLKVIIPSALPDQEKPDYMMHANALMLNIIKGTPGKTIAIFSSKRTLHQAYYAQATNLKNHDIQLLSQDFSGGRGKMIEKFIGDPEHTALFGTMSFLEKLDLSTIPCENFIFQKIPFDPPFDPIIKMQESRYMNPFMEYALPETITRFLGFLNQFLKNPADRDARKNLYILDNRLLSKSYGKAFLDSLPEGMKVLEN